MYSFKQVSLQELKKIQYESDMLCCDSEWIANWYSTFGKVENNVIGYRKEPYIITAHKDRVLVAIIPLVKLNRTYCKCIKLEFVEFLGQQWGSSGNDVITLESLGRSFAQELSNWVKKNINYHFLFFKYLPKTTVLSEKYKLYHYAGEPFIPVNRYAGYQDFLMKAYAKKFRKQLDRTLRKIKRDGFDLELSTEEINDANFKEIKRISKSKLSDGKGFVYGDPDKEAFFLKLFKTYPSNVQFVKFNQQVIAYVINIDFKDQRLAIDCAFDRDYRTYGAGIHCMNYNIQNSFKQEHKNYSFGVGLDPYKFQFTNQAKSSYMCFDYKLRFRSLLALPYLMYRVKKTDHIVLDQIQKMAHHV